jgi:hypothetical protein
MCTHCDYDVPVILLWGAPLQKPRTTVLGVGEDGIP